MASGNPVNNSGTAPLAAPGLRFSVQFLLAATVMAGIFARWPDFFAGFGRDLTIANLTALGTLLGLPLTVSGDIVSVNGFAMRIIFECSALHYVLILALAILLYTGHSIGYRLLGVAAATLAVLAANAVRLITTGLMGSVSMGSFHFVHEYLWVALFALLVFGIWKVWADGRLRVRRGAALQGAVVVLCCTGVFLLLFASKEAHYRMLAALASPMFQLLLGDPQASVVWQGYLQFSQGGVTAKVGNYFELANIAVYIGLVLPKLREGRKMVAAALIGLVLLVVTYAEFIAMLGTHCIRHPESASLYQGTGTGILLALPMAFYWIVVKLAAREPASP